MRRSMVLGGFLMCAVLASPAAAVDRYGQASFSGRGAAADPDKRLERMAAASTPSGDGHASPEKSARNILRDDPYLRAAFAWLDNK